MKEFYFESCGGADKIHVSRWEPQSELRGIIQIVHGISEHTERYSQFAEFLNEQGFLVVAEDHMGHGKTASANGIPGYFHGGWFSATADTYHLYELMTEEFPRTPYFLLGHSMGSFLCRSILIRYPESNLSGCILCGTGWLPETVLHVGITVCRSVCKRNGETAPSPKLQATAFAGYNRKVEHRQTKFDWLSRDRQQVSSYIADKMCGHVGTAGLYRDMLSGMLYNQQMCNLRKMKKNLPVAFFSGAEDPVGNYGVGVEKAALHFKSAGMQSLSFHLFPLCRHEILNEINKSEIWDYILDWINSILCSV